MDVFITLDLVTFSSMEPEERSTEKCKLIRVRAEHKLHAIAKVKKHYDEVNRKNAEAGSNVRFAPENIQEIETID